MGHYEMDRALRELRIQRDTLLSTLDLMTETFDLARVLIEDEAAAAGAKQLVQVSRDIIERVRGAK